MELEYAVWDPTKNITLLVSTPVERSAQAETAARLMAVRPQVEQVGFLEPAAAPGAELRLQMMGGEFCGNATRAYAMYVARQRGGLSEVRLRVSGCDHIVTAMVDLARGAARAEMPLPRAVRAAEVEGHAGTLVDLAGIAHLVIEGVAPSEDFFRAAEPLFSAAPCRAEKPVKEENTAAAAPAAGEDEWYKVFQQSGPLWDPAASPMGSELDAFFSDDAPKAEIHWNFNEDDPFVPLQEQPVSETPAPVFYPFEEDMLPPTEESPSKEGSAPLHGFDQPFVGGGLPPLGGRMEQPSADQPFFAAASDSEETSWNAGGQAAAPETPFQPGQPYHAAPVENNGFYAGVESKKHESSRPAPHRPFAQKPAEAEKPKKSSKPPKEKPPKPPMQCSFMVRATYCFISSTER